ncbi:hypothetical protein [Pseudoalteromonas byunsanensis]|uniref:Methyltransferase type 11 domain-containing protein n=1 Tax=Pseudoalteromonas byunsanensis TaxID=327939 RepID=A0A1S1MY62_9GAMM|nr:hypothetical protein [Pseudoalteromonas byunsanensis]OHU93707.1 hypothetical protein BIW53_20440 [Pseudoalteromonas byunsanensis]
MSPKEYLRTYYSDDPSFDYEEGFHLNWWQHCYDTSKPQGSMLVIGGGPVISSIITASKYVDSIDFTDFNNECLAEVKQWVEGEGHNWDFYVKKALELETQPTDTCGIEARTKLIKNKINNITQLDILQPHIEKEYNVVDAHFVLDCISDSKDIFLQSLQNACNFLKENGIFQGAFLNRTNGWLSGNNFYKSIPLTEDELDKCFSDLGFKILKSASISLKEDSRTGGYIFVKAIRAS